MGTDADVCGTSSSYEPHSWLLGGFCGLLDLLQLCIAKRKESRDQMPKCFLWPDHTDWELYVWI